MWKSALVSCALVVLASCAQQDGGKSHAGKSDTDDRAPSGFVRGFTQHPLPRAMSDISLANGVTRKTEATGFAFKPPRQYQPIFDSIYESFLDVWIDDFNGDGRADLATSGSASYSKLYLFTQQPDGSLSSPAMYPQVGPLNVGDFTGDGIPDILLFEQGIGYAPNKLGMLSSDAQGKLAHQIAYPELTEEEVFRDSTVLDVDGDGRLDFVGVFNLTTPYGEPGCGDSYDCPYLRIFFGDGKGKFNRSQRIALGVPQVLYHVDAIDMNDDGRKDLILPFVGKYPDIGSVSVAYALPGGGLSALKLLHPGYGSGGGYLTFGDISGDGIADSILTPTEQKYPPEIRVRRLDNTFEAPEYLWAHPLFPGLILVDDFDGDRHPDLISTQILSFGILGLGYYRQSNDTLEAPVYTLLPGLSGTPSDSTRAMASGDLNGDGCKDLIFAGRESGLLFLMEAIARWHHTFAPMKADIFAGSPRRVDQPFIPIGVFLHRSVVCRVSTMLIPDRMDARPPNI